MKESPSPDPTSSLPADGAADALPPRALEPAEAVEAERSFEVDGRTWIARLEGKGAYGTGAFGLGFVEAVHFFAADEPERPLSEALVPRGRFAGLFESELVELLARAIPIAQPEE